jgi:hypothetical protein
MALRATIFYVKILFGYCQNIVMEYDRKLRLKARRGRPVSWVASHETQIPGATDNTEQQKNRLRWWPLFGQPESYKRVVINS